MTQRACTNKLKSADAAQNEKSDDKRARVVGEIMLKTARELLYKTIMTHINMQGMAKVDNCI